ncbi:MAG: tRNA pseudouridine(38-40) synthase TruA [Bacteroidales bacterium]|nr:tRNA pseudouridine(38-40) synthase TruA [Bacteroidales bacterium]
MQRYYISTCYDGANYCGWQIQPNGKSVQEVVSKCLSLLLGEELLVTGAGRTDAGVHARFMPAHFDVQVPIADTVALVGRMNRFLPKDIAVRGLCAVHADAHARFDATARSYEYHVVTEKSPFDEGHAYRLPYAVDFEAMNQAAKRLFDYTDFTSFSKLHTDVKTNDCTIYRAEWEQIDATHWVFHISANRFLRNMVRAVVGTLLRVGRGEIDIAGFCRIIEAKDRCQAGQSVPACALYLTDVVYPYPLEW